MRKFFAKLCLLVVIVVLVQFLVGKYDIEFEELDVLNHHLEQRVDTLFFGDCTDYFMSKEDRDRRHLTRMLKDMNPRLNIGVVTHAAYHLELFRSFCRYILQQSYRPRTIVILINLRSFSPQWRRMPQYQFVKEKIILGGGFRRRFLFAFYNPLMAFHYRFTDITHEEYRNTPIFYEGREVGKLKDYNIRVNGGNLEASLRKKFFLYYMQPLSPDHPTFRAMLDIARMLKANGIRPIFYITPIDYRTGESYYPVEFIRRLKNNTALIRRRLAEVGVRGLDLSIDLDNDAFAWRQRGYPTEYLNEKGRRYVAGKLATELSKVNIGN